MDILCQASKRYRFSYGKTNCSVGKWQWSEILSILYEEIYTNVSQTSLSSVWSCGMRKVHRKSQYEYSMLVMYTHYVLDRRWYTVWLRLSAPSNKCQVRKAESQFSIFESTLLSLNPSTNGTNYSRVDQEKFVEDSLKSYIRYFQSNR